MGFGVVLADGRSDDTSPETTPLQPNYCPPM